MTPAEVISQDEVLSELFGFPKVDQDFEFGFRMQIFNIRMRRCRVKQGLTQRDLADFVGCHASMITKIEGFRIFPKPDIATRIAEILGVEVGFLFPGWLEFYVLDSSSREFVSTYSEIAKALDEHPFSRFRSPLIGEPDRKKTDPLERVLLAERNRLLTKALLSLTAQERDVLVMRFNLNGEGTKTLTEVAEVIGKSQERARQIEAQAFEKLRNWRDTDTLKSLDFALSHFDKDVPDNGLIENWEQLFEKADRLRVYAKVPARTMDILIAQSPIVWQGNKVTTLIRWLLSQVSFFQTRWIFGSVWSFLPITPAEAKVVQEKLRLAEESGRLFALDS